MESTSRPKYDRRLGVARGVGVFGSPGCEDSDRLVAVLSAYSSLREWTTQCGVTLTDDLSSLVELDRYLDAWKVDSTISPILQNEVGLYVGSVLVRGTIGARWDVIPNGQPVIALIDGRHVDVLALVGQRLREGSPSLAAIFEDAAG
jgi:hypothetical protein